MKPPTTFEEDAKNLQQLLQNSRHAIVLTGAGISTLSGIPDFRSPKTGVYSQALHGLPVEEILSLDCFAIHPEYFYEWAKTFVYGLENYQPNCVHYVIAEWQKRGWIKSLYTQNIDILHQRAGSPVVHELHGSPARHHCLKCHAEYDYDFVARKVRRDELPRCPKCGGVIKPDIVFYGENLDEALLEQAFDDAERRADCFVVLGSSLTVQPAAALPLLAARHGANLVIVNAMPTPLDGMAKLHYDDLGGLFRAAARQLDLPAGGTAGNGRP